MKTVEIAKVNVSSYPDIRFKQSWHQTQLSDKKTVLCVSVVEVLFLVFTFCGHFFKKIKSCNQALVYLQCMWLLFLILQLKIVKMSCDM